MFSIILLLVVMTVSNSMAYLPYRPRYKGEQAEAVDYARQQKIARQNPAFTPHRQLIQARFAF
jgi:hypothetical protein